MRNELPSRIDLLSTPRMRISTEKLQGDLNAASRKPNGHALLFEDALIVALVHGDHIVGTIFPFRVYARELAHFAAPVGA